MYIGFLWDLSNCSVSLPSEKLARFHERVHIFMDAYEGHQCPLREVDHIHGSLCYITFIYLDGRSRLPSISNFAASFGQDKRVVRFPPKSMMTDLWWWLAVLSESSPRICLLHPQGLVQDHKFSSMHRHPGELVSSSVRFGQPFV